MSVYFPVSIASLVGFVGSSLSMYFGYIPPRWYIYFLFGVLAFISALSAAWLVNDETASAYQHKFGVVSFLISLLFNFVNIGYFLMHNPSDAIVWFISKFWSAVLSFGAWISNGILGNVA